MSASSPAPAAVRIAVPAGTTGAEAVEAAKLPTHGPHAIVVVRAPDGTLKDLDWRPDSDVEVEAVAIDSPDGLNVLRHSTAHVMAQAVQDLHPEDASLGHRAADQGRLLLRLRRRDAVRPRRPGGHRGRG